MRVPTFTAESSVYTSRRHYHSASAMGTDVPGAGILPQQYDADEETGGDFAGFNSAVDDDGEDLEGNDTAMDDGSGEDEDDGDDDEGASGTDEEV